MNERQDLAQLEQRLSLEKDYCLLAELIQCSAQKWEILTKYQAVVEIRQANNDNRGELIKSWAARLDKSERTIRRMLHQVESVGLAALARTPRTDTGKLMGFKGWKKNSNEEWGSREEAVEYWKAFIEEKSRNGNIASRYITPHQVFNEVKAHAQMNLGLKPGEYPSHMFVYKVLKPIIPQEKPLLRRPQLSPIINNTSGEEKPQSAVVTPPQSNRWLGIKPSISQMGWAILSGEGINPHLVDYGTIETDSKEALPQRLAEIESDLTTVLEEYKPDRIVLETPFLNTEYPSGRKLLQVLGVANAVIYRCCRQLPTTIYTASWKSHLDSPSSQREEIAAIVESLFDLKRLNLNASVDAIAIAYAGWCGVGQT